MSVDLRGTVLRPGDAGYDSARRMWNAAVDHHPAVIVRCTGVEDVRAGVSYARERGMAVSVRSAGHGVAGHPGVDGSVMLDLSRLKGVVVEPGTRRAIVEPGATWAEFDQRCQQHGLAVTGADVSAVGVIGAAIAGGSGWLQRLLGPTCDHIRRAWVVLADGRLVTVDTEHDPDLLWALRGAGANFGVVVSMELQLHPVPTVTAGSLLYPVADAGTVLKGFRDACADAPDELALRATVLNWPPGDTAHSHPVAAISATYFGPPDEARKAMQSVRGIGQPQLDLVRPLTYTQLQRYTEQAFVDGHATATGSELLAGLSDATIDALVELAGRRPTPTSLLSVHQLGGRMADRPPDAGAFSHRGADFHLVLFSGTRPAADRVPCRAWVRDSLDAVHPDSVGGSYVGLLDSPERLHTAYSEQTRLRLARLKARYDAGNLFRANHNVAPSEAT